MKARNDNVRTISHAVPIVILCSLIGACSSDNPSSPAGADQGEIASIIAAAGTVEPGPEFHTTESGGDPTLSEDGNTRFVPTLHHEARNVKDILDLGINESLIWPGQLIYGNGVSSFFYDDIQVPRGPVTISLNLEGTQGNDNLAKTISDPKLSTLRNGIADILKNVGTVPAVANFSKEFVYSKEQLNLALSANASIGSVDIASKFEFSSQTVKTRMIAKYQQVYFSVDIDRPTNPASTAAACDRSSKVPPCQLSPYLPRSATSPPNRTASTRCTRPSCTTA